MARSEPHAAMPRSVGMQAALDGAARYHEEDAGGPSTRQKANVLAREAVLAGRPQPTERWYRLGAYGIAGLRLVLGAAALALPEPSGVLWIGPGGAGRDRAVLVRALACRDVALGLGTVLALRRRDGARRWVLMGALSDLGDAVSSAASFTELPTWRRWLVLGASLGAAASGALCALNLPAPRARA